MNTLCSLFIYYITPCCDKCLVIQELWSVHADTGKWSVKDLEVCATCQQVLSASDLRHHVGSHTLENHFPTLGSSELVSQAWGKK
jgi:hypothetical protein